MMMEWSNPLIPLSVLIASLMGSTHCIGMCTPFVLASSKSGVKGIVTYQFMRLVGYLLTAIPFHFLIQRFSDLSKWTHIISALLMGFLLFFIGLQVLRGKSFHTNSFFGLKILGKVHKIKPSILKCALIGLLTPLIPCGWLYAFLLVAVAQPNQLLSFGFIVIFWMGTLPALSLVGFFGHQGFSHFQGKKRLALAVVLILFGSLTIYQRIGPIVNDLKPFKQTLSP